MEERKRCQYRLIFRHFWHFFNSCRLSSCIANSSACPISDTVTRLYDPKMGRDRPWRKAKNVSQTTLRHPPAPPYSTRSYHLPLPPPRHHHPPHDPGVWRQVLSPPGGSHTSCPAPGLHYCQSLRWCCESMYKEKTVPVISYKQEKRIFLFKLFKHLFTITSRFLKLVKKS